MKLTKTVMKPVEVIDTDLVKVGDQFKVSIKDDNTIYHVKVLKNDNDSSIILVCENMAHTFVAYADDIKDWDFEKVEESKLQKLVVGERYKVLDKNSNDTYYAIVLDNTGKEVCMKRDSGKFTIVLESQIGNVFEFTKLSKEDNNKIVKEPSKKECEDATDKFAKELFKTINPYFDENRYKAYKSLL